MHNFKIWLQAARLRTLPLSVSGILAGTAVAASLGHRDRLLFWLTILTTLAYQVTSNFANDYGDGVKGTDNDNRLGPVRVLQSGALSRSGLKRGVIAAAAVSAVLTLLTLWRAFGTGHLGYLALFILLGALSIWAAIRYTVGAGAYGYRGLGDLFVFLFFGILSVMGTQFLYTLDLPAVAWLPALSIGALATAVLNLNNLRDRESDREAGKNTLIVKIGYENGRRYHTALCVLSFAAMTAYVMIRGAYWPLVFCLLPFAVIGIHLIRIWRIRKPTELDPELKKVALSTFASALLFYFAHDYFL